MTTFGARVSSEFETKEEEIRDNTRIQ